MPRNKGKLIVTLLTVPHMKRLNKGEKEYHVYKDRKEFVTVEAAMAVEAKEKSGIEHPPIIRHRSLTISNIIEQNELEKDGEWTFPNHMADVVETPVATASASTEISVESTPAPSELPPVTASAEGTVSA